jgi:hypothetical protein
LSGCPRTNQRGIWGPSAAAPEGAADETVYQERRGGIVRQAGDGRTIPVANFIARISRDVILDDGEGQQRHFEVERTPVAIDRAS